MVVHPQGKTLKITAQNVEESQWLSENLQADFNDKDLSYSVNYTPRNITILKKKKAIFSDDLIALESTNPLFDAYPITRYPVTLREPMPHQLRMMNIFIDQKKLMFNGDMGVGKTKAAVDAANFIIDAGLAKYCVVFTKATLVNEWAYTMIPQDCDHIGVPLLGNKADRFSLLSYAKSENIRFIVINYEGILVFKEYLHELLGVLDDCVIILDESSKLKDVKTKAHKTLYDYFKLWKPVWVLGLTGTLLTNNLEDALGQFAMLDDTIFGPPSRVSLFKNRYVITAPYSPNVVIGYQHLPEFVRKLHSITYRVKNDVLNLPPKQYRTIALDMSPEIRAIYDQYIQADGVYSCEIEGKPFVYQPPNGFAFYMKARQIANGYFYATYYGDDELSDIPIKRILQLGQHNTDPKIDYILDTLDEVPYPIIVWYAFNEDKRRLVAALQDTKHRFVIIDGKTPKDTIPDISRNFQEGNYDVLIAHPRTAGNGLTLTRSLMCIYMTNSYSVEARMQSEARNYRKTTEQFLSEYQDHVLCIDLVYNQSVEVDILQRLRAKENIARKLASSRPEQVDKEILFSNYFESTKRGD